MWGVAVKHFVQRVWPPLKRYHSFGPSRSIEVRFEVGKQKKREKERKKEKKKEGKREGKNNNNKRRKRTKKEAKGLKNKEKPPQAGTESRGIRLKRNWK